MDPHPLRAPELAQQTGVGMDQGQDRRGHLAAQIELAANSQMHGGVMVLDI